MNAFLRSIFVMATVLSATLCLAQSKKPGFEKEPAWVVIHSPVTDQHQLDPQANDGFIDLLYDKQYSVTTRSHYSKRAIRILSGSGVQNASEVRVTFDPSYSNLVFHTIRIIRDKEIINKLDLSKIKTIQQEGELNRFLYNGSLSAVLFLEDVRKGDIIEYSYTIKGENPVFKGKFSAWLETAFDIPIYNLYYRIVMPQGRNLQVKNSQESITCSEMPAGTEHSYNWQKSNLMPLHAQDMLPGWYDPYGMICVSEYRDWKEVKDWAGSLFPTNINLSAPLKKKIEEIRTSDADKEKQVLAALQFVQDDVRYLGIEMGEGSHKPHHPDQVFNQRFGDCKDKSYLLCTMLKNLGIEASPVLINSTYKKTMQTWLASPTVFDHATVRIRLEGHDYYFDPTISYQRGRLQDITYPDYQFGLVIQDTANALTAIAPQYNKGLVDVKEEFTIPDMKGTARFVVKTTYSGVFADNAREDFNSSSIYEMQKKYKTFYENYYEKITIDSLTYKDDDATGKFITFEYYAIDEFWKKENGQYKAYVTPYVINGQLRKPSEQKRSMPFRISHPAKYVEELVVKLPEQWNSDILSEDIKCAAFTMRAQSKIEGNELRLKYEYETLKDNVMPEETKDYLAKYEQLSDNIGYMLSKNADRTAPSKVEPYKKKGPNVGFIVLSVLLISGAIIWWTQRR